MKAETTNAMRILARAKVPFDIASYEVDESDLSGVHISLTMGIDPARVYKTLVARGDKNGINVFVIPVAEELDLKKCAKVSSNKSVEMIAVKELFTVTGYIRGGCSPIGMKKKYPTYIDESCLALDSMYVSAGKRGLQLIMEPEDLIKCADAAAADLTR